MDVREMANTAGTRLSHSSLTCATRLPKVVLAAVSRYASHSLRRPVRVWLTTLTLGCGVMVPGEIAELPHRLRWNIAGFNVIVTQLGYGPDDYRAASRNSTGALTGALDVTFGAAWKSRCCRKQAGSTRSPIDKLCMLLLWGSARRERSWHRHLD